MTSFIRAQEPKAPVTYCDHALSVVRRPLDYLHFQLLLQNRLIDFDETWYGWSTQGPLQVLLFFGQIRPGADPGRGKNRSRGVPFFRKLLLQTWRLQRKRKRSDSVLWQKPLHQQKCQKGKVTTQTTPQKSSIKQRLRTDLGRSVGVTTATQLVWLTGLRAHLPTNRNSRLIKRTHV